MRRENVVVSAGLREGKSDLARDGRVPAIFTLPTHHRIEDDIVLVECRFIQNFSQLDSATSATIGTGCRPRAHRSRWFATTRSQHHL